jgi:hypothetical protein
LGFQFAFELLFVTGGDFGHLRIIALADDPRNSDQALQNKRLGIHNCGFLGVSDDLHFMHTAKDEVLRQEIKFDKNEKLLLPTFPMSYLSACLSQLMTQYGLKGADITRATGLDSATISRWLTGTQVSIRDEDIEKVAKAVSKKPEEQAMLIAARMKDVCKGPGSNLIEIRIGSRSVLREEAQSWGRPPLPEKYEHAFRILAENMNDPDVRDLVLSVAGLLDRADPADSPEPVNPRKPARVRKLRGIDSIEEN